MNQGLMGAFAGLGQGLADAGKMNYQNHLEEKRLALQARIRREERAEDRAFKQDLLSDKRAYEESQQPAYEDVTDDNGNIIGQRETRSNQYTPYSTKGTTDLPERQKLAVESLNEEIKAIYKSAEAMGGALPQESQDRLDRLTLQRNAILYGGGSGTTLTKLLAGEGGDGAGSAPEPGNSEPEGKPEGMAGLINSALQSGKQQEQGAAVQAEIEALESEADRLLDRLSPGPSWKAGPGGRPTHQARSKPSAKDLAAAEALVQKIIALDEDPQASAALSERQRAKLVQRIMDLQKAGVPINLDPKR